MTRIVAAILFGLTTTSACADDALSLADVMQAQRQECSVLSQQELLDKGADCPKAAQPAAGAVGIIAGVVSFAALAASVFTSAPTATLGWIGVSIGADQVGK